VTAFVLTFLVAGLACALEVLETVMIVLAVGIERNWRDALIGTAGAVAILAVALAGVGPVLVALDEDVLHLLIGAALLWFGGQWLRKGILRMAGLKARSSAQKEFLEGQAAARELAAPVPGKADWPARILAGKSVLLEGVEVALIVTALGADRLVPAVLGAGVAVIAVPFAAYALRGPLMRIPESQLKYGVGVVLVSFGIFFFAEGLGLEWPLGDVALLLLAVGVWALSWARVHHLASRVRHG